MQILANECISKPIIDWLQEIGHDVLSILKFKSPDQRFSDLQVLNKAIQENRILLTYDKHFRRQLREIALTNSEGVLAVRVRKKPIFETKDKLSKFFSISEKIDFRNSIVVITGNYFELRTANGVSRYSYALEKIE